MEDWNLSVKVGVWVFGSILVQSFLLRYDFLVIFSKSFIKTDASITFQYFVFKKGWKCKNMFLFPKGRSCICTHTDTQLESAFDIFLEVVMFTHILSLYICKSAYKLQKKIDFRKLPPSSHRKPEDMTSGHGTWPEWGYRYLSLWGMCFKVCVLNNFKCVHLFHYWRIKCVFPS